ncbi:MAG TPA: YaiI/YqxD family protein [Polyangiales bacterium]|nr:YaiI/YqxD family protein [Polyangiales bacterium]
MSVRIWIDADACPRDVKEMVFRASGRLQLPVMVVANKAMFVPPSPLITMVQVAGGPDVADDHIASGAAAGDLAITADIPLAARLVPKKVVVLNPRGEEYDAENIGERLSVRDFLTEAREVGIVTGGPSAYGPKDKQRFANALDRALHRLTHR